jgi:energy-coupling factor transporter ATP-binding protein EcfA2
MRTLIVGITGCGKSTIAKKLAAKAYKKKPVLVFDPYSDNYRCHLNTPDIDLFCRYVLHNKNCLCIIDEAGEVLSKGSEHTWLGTQTRHLGHDMIFICQVATMLSRPIRTSCNEVYAFRQGALSAKTMAEEFACAELGKCAELGAYEYYHLRDFTKISKHVVTI